MKSFIHPGCLLLLSLPAFLCAQPAPVESGPGPSNSTTPTTARSVLWADADPIRGVQELTFGGSGGSNRHLSDSFGGATASYGVYLNNEWQAVVRQSITYSNPDNAGRTWNGSTKLAFDYHITTLQAWMPFFGANAGRIYGSALRDSWSAGLEVGAKYYVKSKVFIFAMVEYSWLFQRSHELDDNFGSGHLSWTTGIGFNF
jgi:hypothetical protein